MLQQTQTISQLLQRMQRLESELQILRGADSASWIRAKGGGGAEAKWWKYDLTTDFTDETSYYLATADLTEIGTGATVEDAEIRDYIGHAVHQVTGDHGLVTLSNGIYLVITPECNFLTPIPVEP